MKIDNMESFLEDFKLLQLQKPGITLQEDLGMKIINGDSIHVVKFKIEGRSTNFLQTHISFKNQGQYISLMATHPLSKPDSQLTKITESLRISKHEHLHRLLENDDKY
ncbi:hypothetical protein WJR50_14245 [Catalinimonas sp. 4WD22]|uniref:hypothetical protein n=1 Tax=Catalinimonas locisalis TaxID=3133978 RepID=UPI0031014A97